MQTTLFCPQRSLRALPAAVATLCVALCATLSPGAYADEERGERGDRGERGERSDAQVKRGFEIVPAGVFLHYAKKNRELVGLGSYIVNTGGCADCHTHPTYLPGGDPFKGQPELINFQQYMTGGQMFGPFIKSANLTPDASGHPAGLTLAEFISTMRTGHNPHDPAGQILQVMPWPPFGKKTDRDLTAIYEFLRALPSLPDNPAPGP